MENATHYTLYSDSGSALGHFARWEWAIRYMRLLHREGVTGLRLKLEGK